MAGDVAAPARDLLRKRISRAASTISQVLAQVGAEHRLQFAEVPDGTWANVNANTG